MLAVSRGREFRQPGHEQMKILQVFQVGLGVLTKLRLLKRLTPDTVGMIHSINNLNLFNDTGGDRKPRQLFSPLLGVVSSSLLNAFCQDLIKS